MSFPDPRFLEWLGRCFKLMAENTEVLEKAAKSGEATDLFKLLGSAGFLPPPPFPPEALPELNRQWLRFMGAVPEKDFKELEKRVEKLEAALLNITRAAELAEKSLSRLETAPEAMKPWLDFAQEMMKLQQDWMERLAEEKPGSKKPGP